MTIALLFIFDIEAIAQKKDYKPGEKIEYLAATYPEELWEEGIFVGPSYDGSQPIIRQKPDQFHKGGFETAFHWNKIRPLGSGKVKPAPIPTKEIKNPEDETTPDTAPTVEGKGLMTKTEIIEYLKTRVGTDGPHPKKRKFQKNLLK